jgi:hypothetical protein
VGNDQHKYGISKISIVSFNRWYEVIISSGPKMIKIFITVLIAIFSLCSAGIAMAHGGGLDGNGCHTRRATGEYHCHRSGNSTPTNKAIPQQNDATCHVGPRGGRYRIVNGRKRYGC